MRVQTAQQSESGRRVGGRRVIGVLGALLLWATVLPGGVLAEDAKPLGVDAALAVGYGFSFGDTLGGTEPLGLGLGLIGGVPLGEFYAGGRFMYYFGGSAELPTGNFSMESWQLAAELGYLLDLSDDLRLRPGVVFGAAIQTQTGPTPVAGPGVGAIAGSGDDTAAVTYLAPGAALQWTLGDLMPAPAPLYLGTDARFSFQLGNRTRPALELLATIGAHL